MVPIRLESLRRVFGTTVAVHGVDLSIPAGQLFFLLGPSGCGKTTLLRMIAGFLEPSGGRVLFGERNVTNLAPEKRNAGMVFQSYALWPHLTVFENVAFGLRVRRVPRAELERRVHESLEMVRMADLAARRPNQLSGGQQQRVALARAIVFRPEVLLLDEPLSNLDAKLRLEMRHEIRRICTEIRMTTVYVTHDRDEAMSLADGMVVLRDGRIEQQGAPRELYERPKSRFVAEFLGESNFLGARNPRSEPGATRVESSAGVLVSATPLPEGEVIVSIRPEAIRLSKEGSAAPDAAGTGAGSASAGAATRTGAGTAPLNRLEGRVRSTTYLGGTAQHAIEVGGALLKVFEANPRRENRAGESVTLEIDASQVVTLPAS